MSTAPIPQVRKEINVHFTDRLNAAIEKSGGHVCVGLDPDPEQIPATKGKLLNPEAAGEAIREFGKNVIEATWQVPHFLDTL